MRISLIVIVLIMVFATPGLSQTAFGTPESVIYDSARDRYFVANVGNARLIEINSEHDTTVYYTSYPRVMGMVIVGDTLFVTSANKVLAFNLATDELSANIPIAGSSDLNDITADTSGFLYITDSGGQRVYKMNISDHSQSVIVSGIYWPNGILFDPVENRLFLCAFGTNAPIRSVSLDGSSISVLVNTPLTNLDGLTEDNEGYIYVSSWGTNAVYRYTRDFINPPEIVSTGHFGPADIYYDRVNELLLVPNFYTDEVDFVDIDIDNDGLLNAQDNCPEAFNPDQEDSDFDQVGDSCDLCPGYSDLYDDDGDGMPDDCDICPGYDDFADNDLDGVPDGCDLCPGFDDSIDSDSDGIPDGCDWLCGDANGDDGVNIGDVVYIGNHVFRNGECATNPPIGCPPDPYEAGDVNCDESVNVGDAVYLGNVIFRPGSPAPCAACP